MIVSIFYFTVISFVLLLLMMICYLINIKFKYDREKYSVFECGFDLMNKLRLPFSLNFYFVTIIFLIFDVELTLILPFVFNTKFLYINQIVLVMVLFFIILIIGFVYEWMVGLLNWLI